MFGYRPEWLDKDERLIGYESSSHTPPVWKSISSDGTVHYYKKFRKKYARKAIFTKTS